MAVTIRHRWFVARDLVHRQVREYSPPGHPTYHGVQGGYFVFSPKDKRSETSTTNCPTPSCPTGNHLAT